MSSTRAGASNRRTLKSRSSCARSPGWGVRTTMREIVLDTETTGLSPADGHRVLEIGAVEIVHQALTGKVFHTLLNPERDVPQDAVRIHGHTAAALGERP